MQRIEINCKIIITALPKEGGIELSKEELTEAILLLEQQLNNQQLREAAINQTNTKVFTRFHFKEEYKECLNYH